jgi:hypothetical protein
MTPRPYLGVAACLACLAAGCDASYQSASVDAGALIAATFACDVPASAASKGSCVEVLDAGTHGDGGTFCNPVTNGSCPTGNACDVTSANGVVNGFDCYATADGAELCAICNDTNGPLCAPGLSCANASADISGCARYCCTDADCGAGRCAKSDSAGNALFGVIPGLGLCAAGSGGGAP